MDSPIALSLLTWGVGQLRQARTQARSQWHCRTLTSGQFLCQTMTEGSYWYTVPLDGCVQTSFDGLLSISDILISEILTFCTNFKTFSVFFSIQNIFNISEIELFLSSGGPLEDWMTKPRWINLFWGEISWFLLDIGNVGIFYLFDIQWEPSWAGYWPKIRKIRDFISFHVFAGEKFLGGLDDPPPPINSVPPPFVQWLL